MVRRDAIVATTGVIPMYGRALLDEDDLLRMAKQLLGQAVPMLVDHDPDQPIRVTVAAAEVRPIAADESALFVTYDVPDEEASKFGERMGMSIGFPRPLIVPDDDVEPDSGLWVDPNHFTRAELAVATQRLNRAGFTPAGGAYFQLSELPPPTVVFEFLDHLPKELGWAVIAGAMFEGLKILLHRGEKTHFRIVRRSGEDRLTAEIHTSSDRALRTALKGLSSLEKQQRGSFIREGDKWRRTGSKRRRRNGPRK